jgi:hypothetical protein
MAIANFFNPNGTATDDITQLKMLSDDNNGELETVVNEQLISKYGSLDKLYDQYQSEQSAGAGAGMGALPESDVAYNEKIARLIAESGAGTGNDMMVDYFDEQPNAVGQMQALVDKSGSGGEVIAASAEVDNGGKPNPDPDPGEQLTFGKVVSKIAGIPFQAVEGMYNKVGSAYETLTDEDKFAAFLQSPQTQAGLRMIQEGGTPSFASPFARMSKALIDTSTYLSAADQAKAGSKGKNRYIDMLYLPGNNTMIDNYLKLMPYSKEGDKVISYYDYLQSQSLTNKYNKITLEYDSNNNLIGIDSILKPNDKTYTDETFDNYTVGTNANLDALLSSDMKEKIKKNNLDGGTNKITANVGPNGLFDIDNIEIEGLKYNNEEFFAVFGENEALDKALIDSGYDNFKKGDRVKIEGLVGSIAGKKIYGTLDAALAPDTKDSSTALKPNETDVAVQAKEDVTAFYETYKVSEESSQTLADSVNLLGTLDNPMNSLGILQSFFQPFANIADRMFGDTALGQRIQTALQGGTDVFKTREIVGALVKNDILPKLKALYPVSDKDVSFLEQTRPNLSSKSFFKLASLYQGIYGYDELTNEGINVWLNRLEEEGLQVGMYSSTTGIDFNGKKYTTALDYARAWAEDKADKTYASRISTDDKESLADLDEAARAFGYNGIDDPEMRSASKLAILNFADTKEQRTGKEKAMGEKNRKELVTIFSQKTDPKSLERAQELSTLIMSERVQINNIYKTLLNNDSVDMDTLEKSMQMLVDEFEDTYGITYAGENRDYKDVAWGSVDLNKENADYVWILNNDLGLGM